MGPRQRICSWWNFIPLLVFLAAHGSQGSPSQAPVLMPPKLVDVARAVQVSILPMQDSVLSAPSGADNDNWKRISLSTESHAPSVTGGNDRSPSISPSFGYIRRGGSETNERYPEAPPIAVPPPQGTATATPTLLPVPGLPVNPPPSPALLSPANPWKRFAISPTEPPKDASKTFSPVNDSHTQGVAKTSPPPHGTFRQNHTQAPQVSRPPLPLWHIPHTPVSHEASNPLAHAQSPHISPLISHLPFPLEQIPDSPSPHEAKKPSKATRAPLSTPSRSSREEILHSPAAAPSIPPLASQHQHPTGRTSENPAPAPVVSSHQQISMKSPAAAPLSRDSPLLRRPAPPHNSPKESRKRGWRYHASPSRIQGPNPPAFPPKPFSRNLRAPVPNSPPKSYSRMPRARTPDVLSMIAPSPLHLVPSISPPRSFPRNPTAPKLRTVHVFPPPPPNLDCSSLICSEPLINTPPGLPCACVLPIKVGLRLSIALYTFFPLVSELAREIASGIFLKQSQVHIMGANSANEDPGKTIVLLDLVPHGSKFDYTTAFLIFEKFWHIQVPINSSFFGNYDVLYVVYPGLPPSPPTAPSYFTVSGGTMGNGNNGRTIIPLAVDVPKRNNKLNGSLIAIIVLSSVVALLLIAGVAWLLLLRCGNNTQLRKQSPLMLLPPNPKLSVAGTEQTILGSRHSSASASFSSTIGTYTGSAKTYTLAEMERATKNFADSHVIGEGGFGRVYQGTLEDGTKVAVKVLKRDDHQGGREFLAEVEMLSRLHHRNLVKLIGICTEDIRCLVYELIPNGSVESHLHGHKETAPLDWNARTKIALGAARALAYLHEDSSPRVIHRDFKASNILLEHDYTPKVSDFGLARTALGEGNEHISTQVMGTFGYVAPEYAMTGHLLVKSDVYSYGVVLLELLTGMKPVDMLQPPGQENLVTRARPLLTSKEGLQTIVDPGLGNDYPFDNVAKVAAIASMCVQPEVSHRPFMGEVVQALRLVCNETGHHVSDDYSQDYSSASPQGVEHGTSASDAGSFWRHSSSSCPQSTGHDEEQYWRRTSGFSTGSMSKHELSLEIDKFM